MNICEWIPQLVFVTFSLKSCSRNIEKYSLDHEGLFKYAQAKNSPKATNGGQNIFNLMAAHKNSVKGRFI